MPIRHTKRADGRYTIVLTLAQADDTKTRAHFYGRTQSEAKRKAQAACDRLEQGAPICDARCTVSD